MIIRQRKEIIGKLKSVDASYKGTTMGSSSIKRFCKEAIRDLDGKMEHTDSRENVEALTGIKIRKVGNIVF